MVVQLLVLLATTVMHAGLLRFLKWKFQKQLAAYKQACMNSTPTISPLVYMSVFTSHSPFAPSLPLRAGKGRR